MRDHDSGHSGGCRCGAIRYKTKPHTGNAYICNCHFCQKTTGGPFLVEHCFTKDEIDILSGTPAIYTHVSAGSGKEIYLHFCKDCGSHLFLTLERWKETMNVFTTTFDDPNEVSFTPETLRYLFLSSAQSGTMTPKGYHTYEGHCEPADGSGPVEHLFEEHALNSEKDLGTGPHEGGCLCGAIRYEAMDQPEAVVICHCRSCQKSLGSGVNFELLWTPDKFRVVKGTPKTFAHPGGSGKMIEKSFCPDCGTSLWLTGERFPEIGVFRGTLDRPNRIEVSSETALQIFLNDALPSGMVLAGIETYPEHRRAPDGTINSGRTYDHPWRIGDGKSQTGSRNKPPTTCRGEMPDKSPTQSRRFADSPNPQE